MKYRTFVTYNVIGGVAVGASVSRRSATSSARSTSSSDNIEFAIIVLVAISLLPMVFEVIRHQRNAKRAHGEARTAVPVTASTVGRRTSSPDRIGPARAHRARR